MSFDDLIRSGRDTDAMRYLAKEYYDNGKMGHTRKLLLERVADKLDAATNERVEGGDGMKHIVQFSGGAGSAMAAYLVAQHVPKEEIILLFHDVQGGHDEDIYRFNADVSRFLGMPITEYSDNRTMIDVIKENKCLPSVWIPFCTRVFKLETGASFYNQLPYFAYHRDNPNAEELALYPNVDYQLYAGYCAGEECRIDNAKSQNVKVNYPVYDNGLTSDDCKQIISEEWGIELPRAYQWFEHNNCIPCWKSTSKDYWQLVWKHYPDRYQTAMEMEEYVGHTHFKTVSLKELAAKWEGDKQ